MRLRRYGHWIPLTLFSLAVAISRPARCPGADLPEPLVKGEQFLGKIEAYHRDFSKLSDDDRETLLRELDEVDSNLRVYLATNPAPNPLWYFTTIKLEDAQECFDVLRFWNSGEPGVFAKGGLYIGVMKRAVAAYPKDAAFHYYLGQFWFNQVSPNEDPPFQQNGDLAEAIRETRLAVSLEPTDENNRRALGYFLIAKGDYREAAQIYKSIAKGKHPVSQLLSDWERMPELEGFTGKSSVAARTPEGLSELTDDAGVRGRVYCFPGTAAAFEERCKKTWPSARLTSQTDSTHAGEDSATFSLHLIWQGDKLTPAAATEPAGDAGGFLVQVHERTVPAPSSEDDRPEYLHPGVQEGKPYCLVEIVDTRPETP